ncbi:peptidase inhibitor family I36 protein [Amycolatopsis thailandensis]|uniref:peptidase inhibitor family I36 protein n=1 Tax=Amycolatopsis thailandensis TaxID=589330 RepID=UPI003641682B
MTSTLKTMFAVCTTTAMITLSSVTLTGTSIASAASCPSGALCLYAEPSYAGDAVALTGSVSTLGSFGDRASSVVNNTGVVWCLFEHTGYSGKKVKIPANARTASLGTANDIASSAANQAPYC